jgi:hypothetical protein
LQSMVNYVSKHHIHVVWDTIIHLLQDVLTSMTLLNDHHNEGQTYTVE